MDNKLRSLEKALRSFAKRCKEIKYSKNLLFTFLLTGSLSQAILTQSEDTSVEGTKKQLTTSIDEMKKLFKEARKENEKLLKSSNIELIQLMEQGDQVIKLPWASWQFGQNYIYNDWKSIYKGRGDKKEYVFYQRSTNLSERIAGGDIGRYGTTFIKGIYEPISAVPVDAAVTPKYINKEPLLINLPTIEDPQPPAVNVNVPALAEIPRININPPSKTIEVVNPNTNPFSDFLWGWLHEGGLSGQINSVAQPGQYNGNTSSSYWYAFADNVDISGGDYWSGVDTGGNVITTSGYSNSTYSGTGIPHNYLASRNFDRRHQMIINSYKGRWTNTTDPQKITGGNFYVRGVDTLEPGASATGTAAFHIVGDIDFSNVTVNLYGKAAFINAESFRGGITNMQNVKVNILGDNNTVFNIQGPGIQQDVSATFSGRQFATKFKGNADITVDTTTNTIFAVNHYSGGTQITNTGKLLFNGASNIGFSFLTYVPDKSKYIGTTVPNWATTPDVTGEPTIDDYKPFVKTSSTSPIKMYGDENVGIFFNSSRASKNERYPNVGIHQGTFELYMDIGEQLSSTGGTTQSSKGNIANNPKYTDTQVDGNVGVYAISGQRAGIEIVGNSPSHIVPTTPSFTVSGGSTTSAIYGQDPIHDLWIDKFAIRFGKYARNGFMFFTKNGTVIDIRDVATSGQADFSDGINGTSTTQADSSVGTIIAYAEGTWKTADTLLVGAALEGQATEIKVNQELNMISDKGIAFFGRNGGKVTVTKDTKAYGYGSVVAYAEAGTVESSGKITAIDDIASPIPSKVLEKFSNIGGYATNGGKVNITGDTEVKGLGALANGTGSKVVLDSTNNKIYSGTQTGLASLAGGVVEFNGGTVEVKDDVDMTAADSGRDSHRNATPFYSGTGGQVIFKGATTIDMYNGVLITGDTSDYKNIIDNTSKYQGLNNVTVNIHGDKVKIGSFRGLNNLVWDDKTDANSTFKNGLPGISSFGSLNVTPGSSFKTILTEGNLNVTAPTVVLDDSTDIYNSISMANEVVTISNGTSVTGNISSGSAKGQGLSMGALDGNVISNTTTGFINNGTVNLTGGVAGGTGIAGINVSFGTAKNGDSGSASISIDNGVGIYGTNGSRLENTATGIINVTGTGVGIAGFSKDPSSTAAIHYGVNKLISTPDYPNIYNQATGIKEVEIINKGSINVAGDKAVVLFADNNTSTESVAATRQSVTIENEGVLTVGNEGVGIALLNSGGMAGGTITSKATGTGVDIKTGINGKGIYAQDSNINLIGGKYVIETKENGLGIFASGDTNLTGSKLEYIYTGSATGTGMGIVYDKAGASNTLDVDIVNGTSTVEGLIGIYSTASTGIFTNTGNIKSSSVTSEKEFGIVSNGGNLVNTGNIELGTAISQANANVGIYSKARNTTSNTGNIKVGDNAIAIYGYGVNHNGGIISVGNNGVGIYTTGNGSLSSTPGVSDVNVLGAINVGSGQAVGIYSVGEGQSIVANPGSSFTMGDDSFGFVSVGKDNTVISRANALTLGNDSVYIYQNDSLPGKVFNYTQITSSGDRNYGLYGNGIMENYADINFTSGNGNVAVYSTGGTSTNYNRIDVSGTNLTAREYGAGMATGYYNLSTGSSSNQGRVINKGIINVSQPNSIGMYATGVGSIAENYGDINLSGNDTVGMYIDKGASGVNWGTIKTTASGLTGVKGIYLANGSYIKNYGTISIDASDSKSAGIWTDLNSQNNIEVNAVGVNPDTGITQTGTSTPGVKVVSPSDEKSAGGINVKIPPKVTTPTVTIESTGEIIPITKVDTNIASPSPTSVTVTSPSGATVLDISNLTTNHISFSGMMDSIGLYVDTSGINYTKPIQGLSNLTGATEISLYFGSEAAKYTNAKAIEVGDNILKPYNDELATIVVPGTTLNVTSAGLTWIAQPTKSPATGLLDKVYLIKIPYTAFSNTQDENTYNFLAGLEERYSLVEGREKDLINRLNDLGKGEAHIFAQAIDQMKGNQYADVQRRMYSTGTLLDKEFDYLREEWDTTSKSSNKIKAFGTNGEYKTGTAGIEDYSYKGYGVAYVHENETIKLGQNTGWYMGALHNRVDFKDIGKSKENTTMIKAGLFKSTSFDHNGSLKWGLSVEGFAAISEMDRKFLVVDEVFGAKSTYNTYGFAVKNEIGKEFRTGERFSIRPYGSLKLEYGRFTGIKEKLGEMKLDVKAGDYYSIRPEVGIKFKYKQPMAVKTNFTTTLGFGYENELGQVGNVSNRAKIQGTSSDYYKLRGEKDDRKGNFKADLNVGLENQKFGVTINAGYDTKGENIRGGIGFRAIY